MVNYIKYLWQRYVVVRPKYDLLPHLDIKTCPSPNYNKADKRSIKCIVLHNTMSDSLSSTLTWFKNRLSGVSAHYVIDKDGSITQCVALKDVAWHAGKSEWRGNGAVNQFSLGLELVSKDPDGKDITKIQGDTALTLCWVLANMYGLNADSITTHKDISTGRKSDQGVESLEEFKKALSFYKEHSEVFKE